MSRIQYDYVSDHTKFINEEMKKNPYRYKRYNSFSEAMDEIFKDD